MIRCLYCNYTLSSGAVLAEYLVRKIFGKYSSENVAETLRTYLRNIDGQIFCPKSGVVNHNKRWLTLFEVKKPTSEIYILAEIKYSEGVFTKSVY
jgi:hypothetical protein